jgi:hypothetical protein
MHPDRIDALSRRLADATSRRRLLTLLGVGAASTSLTVVGLNEALAKSKKDIGPLTNQLTNIPMKAQEGDRKFTGKLSVQTFELQGESIVAVAKLTGKVDKKQGKGTKKISRTVRVPVTVTGQTADVQSQVICEILNLVLGPINLNILGLRLQTNTIRIRLTADSQGGLLGSLLCGLTGPIDLGNLGALIALLNDILCELTGGTVCP